MSIQRTTGRLDSAAAQALFRLARKAGAELRPAQNSISVRLPGLATKKPEWLTLFVISEADTFYTNWTQRWRNIGVPASLSQEYRRRLRDQLGIGTDFHPTAYKHAVPLSVVRKRLRPVSAAIASTARTLRRAVQAAVKLPSPKPDSDLSDYEGVLTETRVFRRKRSAELRAAALEASRGRCATCGRDFGTFLGGRGWRVLQAHHREQLAATDRPRLRSAADLAILCANCHLLVHYDPKEALKVEDLRSMLKAGL